MKKSLKALKRIQQIDDALIDRPYDDIDSLSESIVAVVEQSNLSQDLKQTDRIIAACGRAAMYFLESRGGSEEDEEIFHQECRQDLKFFKAVFRKRYENSNKEQHAN